MKKSMTQEEYQQTNGDLCPNCRSGNVNGSEVCYPGISNAMYAERKCFDCQEKWQEKFKLVSYEGLTSTLKTPD